MTVHAPVQDVQARVHVVRRAERALSAGTWLIVAGAMLYSVLTVTPLMAAHTPPGWRWTAPILPAVVDAAVVIVVRLDSVLARLGGHGGRWPAVLRWMTGGMTLALNTAGSALHRDPVGVAVHAVAPLLLIVTAETGLAYRRALAAALSAAHDAERAAHEARERARREERDAAERREREAREHAAQVERERHEREAEQAREAREHEARTAREAADRAAAEQAAREREAAEREREQAARERAAADREHAERERARRALEAALLSVPPPGRLPEHEARALVGEARRAGLPVRRAAEVTGWSVGWVSARYQELHDTPAAAGGPGPALPTSTAPTRPCPSAR